MQEREKNEDINVAFCYWDGSSHRLEFLLFKNMQIFQTRHKNEKGRNNQPVLAESNRCKNIKLSTLIRSFLADEKTVSRITYY